MRRKPAIALALGGGGARGIAHLGVIKAFEAAGVTPDLIVGSSAGALVGAAYATKADIGATLDRVLQVFGSGHTDICGFRKLTRFHYPDGAKDQFLDRMLRSLIKEILVGYAMFRKAVLSEKDLHECTAVFVPDINIEDTQIPMVVLAVNIISGNIVALKKGSLVRAVMASCAVPGFMPPVRMDGMMLVDGAVASGIPAAVARSAGIDMVIGVDVGACLCRPPVLDNGIDIINRAAEIMNFHLTRLSGRLADKLIVPNVKRFDWTDFHRFEDLIIEGEKAAKPICDELVYKAQSAQNDYRRPLNWKETSSCGRRSLGLVD